MLSSILTLRKVERCRGESRNRLGGSADVPRAELAREAERGPHFPPFEDARGRGPGIDKIPRSIGLRRAASGKRALGFRSDATLLRIARSLEIFMRGTAFEPGQLSTVLSPLSFQTLLHDLVFCALLFPASFL